MIPTFFVVGAPRCGTSSLVRYLDAHPRVFMCRPKEPHHFGADLVLRPRPYAERDAYLRLFDAAGDVQHAGDGSVLYLYSRCAPSEILELNPAARIIIMLRDPLEMLPSLHAHNLLLNYEDIVDFGQALAAQADRLAGRRVPPSCIPPLALQYVHLARFAEHVERYRESFGPDRVLCLLLDDLRREPERIYARTLAFLELPEAPPPRLEAHNRGLRWRQQRLAQWLLPAYSQSAGLAGRAPTRLLQSCARRTVDGLFYLPMRLNLARARPPRVSPELRAALRDELRDDVARLSELLARDLSAWLRPVA